MDGQEIVTASVIQYRVIRPDGTVLWHHAVASYMDTFSPPPPEQSCLHLGGPEDWITRRGRSSAASSATNG